MNPRTKFRKKSCHPEPRRRRGISPWQFTILFPGGFADAIASALALSRRLGMASLGALALCLTSVHSAWAIGGVDTPPAPSATHVTKFATPKETRLENGLRVIVVERHDLPLLAAQVVVRSGAEVDPPHLAGTASMTGDLLTRGTEAMSAPEIARTIESLGASIDSGAGWDASGATVVMMSDKANEALKVLADVVRHPAFKQEEIDRLKSQRLDGLRVALQQAGSLARFVTARTVYGTGAYGHAVSGTLETVQAITRDQIVRLYQTVLRAAQHRFRSGGRYHARTREGICREIFWRLEKQQPCA